MLNKTNYLESERNGWRKRRKEKKSRRAKSFGGSAARVEYVCGLTLFCDFT